MPGMSHIQVEGQQELVPGEQEVCHWGQEASRTQQLAMEGWEGSSSYSSISTEVHNHRSGSMR